MKEAEKHYYKSFKLYRFGGGKTRTKKTKYAGGMIVKVKDQSYWFSTIGLKNKYLDSLSKLINV